VQRRERRLHARYGEGWDVTYEGTLRQREFIKGAYRDIKLYAILKSEYRPR
jgi:RimJ/RimL family protein N-acetyltransferase